jgi:hypothetical protein
VFFGFCRAGKQWGQACFLVFAVRDLAFTSGLGVVRDDLGTAAAMSGKHRGQACFLVFAVRDLAFTSGLGVVRDDLGTAAAMS